MNQKINELSDLPARQNAIDPGSSFVVVAPAGSGKTQILIKRYLQLLANARSIDTVLCLTFTNKATEEMRERVLTALKKCRSYEGVDENEKELFVLAKKVYNNKNLKETELINPYSFQIYTFHSFCATLLRKFPSENKVSDFETIDDVEADSLYAKTAEIVISKAAASENADASKGDQELPDAISRRLAALDENIDTLKKQIIELEKNRDRLSNITQYSLDKLNQLVTDLLKKFTSNFIEFFKKERESFNRLLQYFDEETRTHLLNIENLKKEHLKYIKVFADVILVSNKAKIREQRFPEGFNFGADLKNFIKTFPPKAVNELHTLRNIASDVTNFYDEKSLADVLTILNASKVVFDKLLSGSKKDFVDIEMSALDSLKWINGLPSPVLEKMQFKIDHILVDEAQDLSDIEYEIISRLTEGWDQNDGRTVFFVGDPQQSIYRFRKANVALFSLLLNKGLVRKGEIIYPLEKIKLETNFRSNPQIIKFVNTTFSEYFENDDFSDDVAYCGFKHPKETFEDSPVSLNRVEDGKDVALFSAEEESKLYNYFVQTLSSVSKTLSDEETVGILFSRRKQFIPYYKVLKENGIDVDTVEDEYLENSYAIKHLFNLLKAALFPEEDLYWLSILGSPFIDLSPELIYEINKSNYNSWFEKVTNSSLIEEEKRKVLKQMTEDFYNETGAVNFLRHFEELSRYESIKKIYNYQGVEECREFFRILHSLSHLAPKELISALDHFIKSSFSPPNPLIPKYRVQAMTIHKAKGLEFDYVFVIGLNESPMKRGGANGPSPLLIERLQFDEESGVFPFISAPYDKGEITYHILNDLDKRRLQSEYKRIYYVALTRAKKKLFLFGKINKNSKSPNNSIFQRIITSHNLQKSLSQIETQETQAEPEKKQREKTLSLPPDIKKLEPEKVPFKIKRASEELQMSKKTYLFHRISEDNQKRARAKGIAVHKILEHFAKGKNDITSNYVEKLLKNMRLNSSQDFAKEIIEEARAVWEIEEFKNLRKSKKMLPEFSLEMSEDDTIYVGRIDLLLLGENEAVTIDYKTSIPDENLEKWIEEEKGKYRPQVELYKKMISLKENLSQDKIKCYILFTALDLLEEID